MTSIHPMISGDVSPMFSPNRRDTALIEDVIQFAGTGQAIVRFAEVSADLSDYAYWFLLSTLWVGYSGWSDLALWKRLFRSGRRGRRLSIMKPSELEAFDRLPRMITAYRAHRPTETDWISYTIDPATCGRFAAQRGVDTFTEYRIRKADCLAFFTRRGEDELLMLDPSRAKAVRPWDVKQPG